MNIENAYSPAADPASPGPDPDRVADADQSPPDPAAMRALECAQADEMAAMAVDVLRILRIEVLDPDHAPTDLPGTRIRAKDPTLAYVRLTRAARLTLAARARMALEDAENGRPEAPEAAAIRCRREQQIVFEMSAVGMDLLRVLQQEMLDYVKAPTMGQGLWVHAGDPARSFELLTRSMRLNHAIRAKIAEGSLRRRRAKPAAPRGPGRQQAAEAAEAAALAAEDERMTARLSEIAAEIGVDTPDVEDREALFDEDLTEALEQDPDEFAFLDGLLPADAMALTRGQSERYLAMYLRGDDAAPSEPGRNAEASEPHPPGGAPAWGQALAAAVGLLNQHRASLGLSPALGFDQAGIGQRDGNASGTTARPLGPLGRDPP
jgi:hypothetical protein